MVARAPSKVHYPESDGKPLGETQAHFFCILVLVQMLQIRYAADADALVGGDQMMYYGEGDPRQVVAPDAYVMFGVPKEPLRRTLLLWEEGRPPSIVVEATSRKTRREDLAKRAIYERLGVQEYVLFDPLGEYLSPRLQLLALTPAGYAPVEPNDAGRLPSAVLGLDLEPRGHAIALWDPRDGRYLPRPDEEAAARREAELAREAAEAENARLRAELARLKGTGA